MKKITGWMAVALATAVAGDAVAQEITEERVVEITTVSSKKTVAAAKAAAKKAAKAEVEAALAKQAAEPALEYHGYFRSGAGISSKGTAMQTFGLPGRYAWGTTKYRLGNESDTYGELILKANWYTPEDDDDVKFSSVVRLGFWNNNNNVANNWAFYMPEVYAISENALKKGLKFWAGRRFYRRMDVHINDYFHLNNAPYGGGIQDFELVPGGAKLSVGFFGTTSETNPGVSHNPMKSTVDVTVSDIAIGPGQLEVRADFSYVNRVPGADISLAGTTYASEDVSGFFGALIYQMPLMNGWNRIAAQYGNGPMVTHNADFITGYKNLPTANATDGTTKDAWRLAVMDYFVIAPNEKFDMMFLVDFEMGEVGINTEPGFMTVSVGGRPVFHLNERVSLAMELGVDYMDKKYDQAKGYVGKLTIAPQVYAGEGFWGRPVIRAFATAAMWSEDLKGQVGDPTFGDDTFGMNFGLQAESWW